LPPADVGGGAGQFPVARRGVASSAIAFLTVRYDYNTSRFSRARDDQLHLRFITRQHRLVGFYVRDAILKIARKIYFRAPRIARPNIGRVQFSELPGILLYI